MECPDTTSKGSAKKGFLKFDGAHGSHEYTVDGVAKIGFSIDLDFIEAGNDLLRVAAITAVLDAK